MDINLIDNNFKKILSNHVKNLIQGQYDKKYSTFIDQCLNEDSLKLLFEYFDVIEFPIDIDVSQKSKNASRIENNLVRNLSAKFGAEVVRICKDMVRVAPYCLGVFPEKTGWVREDDNNKLSYTPERYFINGLYRGSRYDMHELPFYDYYVNRDIGKLLARIMALSRYEEAITAISKHDGYFDGIFTHLLVNNRAAMNAWAEINVDDRHVTSSLSYICKCLQSLIFNKNELWPIKKVKSLGVYESGVLSVLVGISKEEYEEIDCGIGQMIRNFKRIDFSVYRGKDHPLVCVPALSLLAFALSRGIDVGGLFVKYFNISSFPFIKSGNYEVDLILYPGMLDFLECDGRDIKKLFKIL